MPVTITTIATADPTSRFTQNSLFKWLSGHKKLTRRERALYGAFMRHKSIDTRAFAINDLRELLDDTLEAQQARFASAAPALSAQAISAALRDSGLEREKIACLSTATCTGYLCPGLSSYIIERAGLVGDISAIDLGGMGCGAALPAVRANYHFLSAHPGTWGAAVCTEICSSVASWDDHPEIILSNSLFADGSAACLMSGEEHARGLELIDFTSETAPELRDILRFRHEHGKLKNVLKINVPSIASSLVKKLVTGLLKKNGIAQPAIGAWALHPGGAAILDRLQDALGLADTDLAYSRRVMRDQGNISSPSVLYVLKEILRTTERGTYVLASSFGAGFSAYACLMIAR